MITLPGLIDAHVHLRTPGQTHKEDLSTGTRAALAGGFTTVLDMPNTTPPTTDETALDAKLDMVRKQAQCDVHLFVGGLRVAVADVVAHCTGEEERLLWYQSDVPAVLPQIHSTDVPTVEQKLSALELVEPGQQPRDAGFAGARMSDQRKRLLGLDSQREIW